MLFRTIIYWTLIVGLLLNILHLSLISIRNSKLLLFLLLSTVGWFPCAILSNQPLTVSEPSLLGGQLLLIHFIFVEVDLCHPLIEHSLSVDIDHPLIGWMIIRWHATWSSVDTSIFIRWCIFILAELQGIIYLQFGLPILLIQW